MRTTREGLRLDVARRRRRDDGLARLAQLFVERGPPTFLRSANGPACTATAVRDWLHRVGGTTRFIEPGRPWANGSGESFNGKLRDACLNRERFDTLLEAQILIAGWRREDNPIRPHRALGYRPPAPETQQPREPSHDARPGDRTHLTTGTTIGGRSISRRKEDEAFSMAKKVPNLATATPHRATAEGQPMPPGALLSRHQRRRRPPVPSAS